MCKIKRSTTYLAMYPDYDTNYILKSVGIYRALYGQCNDIEENTYD